MLKQFYNVGTADRFLRFTLGVGLIYLLSLHSDVIKYPLLITLTGVFGLLSLLSSIASVCPACLLANISTTRTRSGREPDTIVAKNLVSDTQAGNTTLLRRKLQVSVVLPMIVL